MKALTGAGRRRLAWPFFAFACWLAAWGAYAALRGFGAPALVGLAAAMLLGAALAAFGGTSWRRVFAAAGFPLSLAVSGLATAL